MKTKFKALVSELDREGLDELARSVRSEMEGRRRQGAIRLEHIHPRMTAEEKERAAQEIARVMKGDEHA